MPATSLRFFVVDFLNGNGMRQTFVKQRKSEIGVLWLWYTMGTQFLRKSLQRRVKFKSLFVLPCQREHGIFLEHLCHLHHIIHFGNKDFEC